MSPSHSPRALLLKIATQSMIERGLEPDFSPAARAEVARLDGPARAGDVEDLTKLLWCSIDNDDSRDLDQLSVAEALPDGSVRVRVAVADVDALVEAGSAVDDHAGTNTTSVYTPAKIFAMLPEELSTDLTSLVEGEERLALVAEMRIGEGGAIGESRVVRARVFNRAKLAYPSVGAWLEGRGEPPGKLANVPGLAENLKLQDRVAQSLKAARHEHGALELESLETRARIDGEQVGALDLERRNRAKELIEDFMIAANGAIARFLGDRKFPILRRVLRSPERWQRIVQLADSEGETLPPEPDAAALNGFLMKRRAADPVRFPDLSLTVIKLLGRGEYAVGLPGAEGDGHFGLAVSDYTHSTAPNRRYPDLITQRLLKAALAGGRPPYAEDQLVALAEHCTRKEDDAQKVERRVGKAAAALWVQDRVGESFDGIVTGASDKGTYVRVLDPPIEGRVTQGDHGFDVGDRVRVKLVHVEPERGFIDFAGVQGHGLPGRGRGSRA